MEDLNKVQLITLEVFGDNIPYGEERYLVFDPQELPLAELSENIRFSIRKYILQAMKSAFLFNWSAHTPKYITVAVSYIYTPESGAQQVLPQVMFSGFDEDFYSPDWQSDGVMLDEPNYLNDDEPSLVDGRVEAFVSLFGFDDDSEKDATKRRRDLVSQRLLIDNPEHMVVINLELNTSEKIPFYREIEITK